MKTLLTYFLAFLAVISVKLSAEQLNFIPNVTVPYVITHEKSRSLFDDDEISSSTMISEFELDMTLRTDELVEMTIRKIKFKQTTFAGNVVTYDSEKQFESGDGSLETIMPYILDTPLYFKIVDSRASEITGLLSQFDDTLFSLSKRGNIDPLYFENLLLDFVGQLFHLKGAQVAIGEEPKIQILRNAEVLDNIVYHITDIDENTVQSTVETSFIILPEERFEEEEGRVHRVTDIDSSQEMGTVEWNKENALIQTIRMQEFYEILRRTQVIDVEGLPTPVESNVIYKHYTTWSARAG